MSMYPFSQPHMPETERALLTEALRRAHTYLEFGMGGSTTLAAWLEVANIIAIESSQEWREKTAAEIARIDTSSQVVLLFADIGETGAWGFPSNLQHRAQWPNYYTDAWAAIRARSLSPDLVLVDGRFRVPCFLYSLLNLNPGAVILWDDYLDRPEYHVVEKYLAPNVCHGNMAMFVVPAAVDVPEILAALFEHRYLVN